MKTCIHCGQTIATNDEVCSSCGGEQPVEWMVKTVYVLAFLFLQGVFYRLIWPNTESTLGYAVYFIVTSALALAAWFYLRKKSKAS